MTTPLDVLAPRMGRAEYVVFTTYAINLRFIERRVGPLLEAVGARHAVILADAAMLGEAMRLAPPLRRLGRSIHLAGVRIGSGGAAFHPKLVLVVGQEGEHRAVVSSANLTQDGQTRNLEVMCALRWSTPEHRRAISDAGGFLRGVCTAADGLPPHTAEIVRAAADAIPSAAEEPTTGPRLIHNLEQRLLDQLPDVPATRAVAPFVDPSGAAVHRLRRGKPMVVHVDAATFAAPVDFAEQDGLLLEPWTIGGDGRAPRRKIHAKTYWFADGSMLVGSANLTQAALAHSAGRGNTEVAIWFERATLDVPATAVVVDFDVDHAVANFDAMRQRLSEGPRVRSVQAWIDTEHRALHLCGLPESTEPVSIEGRIDETWQLLGSWASSPLDLAADVEPTLVRAIVHGVVYLGVVHDLPRLRRVALAGRPSRARRLEGGLGIEIAEIAEISSILEDLAACAAPTLDTALGGASRKGLATFAPSPNNDHPHVPGWLGNQYAGHPDELVALVRSVLRLDGPRGHVALLSDAADVATNEEIVEDAAPEAPAPEVGPDQLRAYGRELERLLQRGARHVADATDETIAGLVFLSLMRLCERSARPDAALVRGLGPRPILDGRRQAPLKLPILLAYIARPDADPGALIDARLHLGDCLDPRNALPVEQCERCREAIYDAEKLLNRVEAEALDGVPDWLHPEAADERVGTLLRVASADRLRDAAYDRFYRPKISARADVFTVAADEELRGPLERSPGWDYLSDVAIAAFRSVQAVAVVVQNSVAAGRSAFPRAHALVLLPDRSVVLEAALRGDDVWLRRDVRVDRDGLARRGAPDDASMRSVLTPLSEGPQGGDPDAIVGALLRHIRR